MVEEVEEPCLEDTEAPPERSEPPGQTTRRMSRMVEEVEEPCPEDTEALPSTSETPRRTSGRRRTKTAKMIEGAE